MLIALYGINNIGKSTQIRRLEQKIRDFGKTIKLIKYPIYDLEPTGPQINYFLRDPEAPKISGESFQMLYIQNRIDYQPRLQKDLGEYDIVLAEDYIGTGIAWGMTQGVFLSWLEKKQQQFPQKKADVEIVLDGERFLSGKENSHRNESDDTAIATTRNNFLYLAKKYHWTVVSANQPEDQVTEDLWKIILPKISG